MMVGFCHGGNVLGNHDDDDDPANVSVKKKPHPVIATTANPAQEY